MLAVPIEGVMVDLADLVPRLRLRGVAWAFAAWKTRYRSRCAARTVSASSASSVMKRDGCRPASVASSRRYVIAFLVFLFETTHTASTVTRY